MALRKNTTRSSGKLITVAKDADAMVALDYDTAQPDQLWEYELTQAEFTALITSDIIDQLNLIGDVMIGDYEDDMVEDPQKLRDALTYLHSVTPTAETQTILSVLIDLFTRALTHHTAIYFYF